MKKFHRKLNQITTKHLQYKYKSAGNITKIKKKNTWLPQKL